MKSRTLFFRIHFYIVLRGDRCLSSFFFCKQKPAYEVRISYWSSDVCSSDLSYVFDSAAEMRAARLLTLDAARKLDAGEQARDEIAIIKVVGARMLHDVIDRAIQVHGAEGLTDDTPLGLMYRHAREARIHDGPDEVHLQSLARRVLKQYREGGNGIDFGDDA